MQSPDDIIMIATDGIYSTKKLDLNYSENKVLGAWDYAKHDGGIFVQSGYYFLKKGDTYKPKTRGFDKLKTQAEIDLQVDRISLFYDSGIYTAYFPCTRFITLGTACAGQNFDKWCTWYEMKSDDGIGRALALTPAGTKREQIDIDCEPGKGLCNTLPVVNLTPSKGGEKYVRGWGTDYLDIDEDQVMNELLEDGYAD